MLHPRNSYEHIARIERSKTAHDLLRHVITALKTIIFSKVATKVKKPC